MPEQQSRGRQRRSCRSRRWAPLALGALAVALLAAAARGAAPSSGFCAPARGVAPADAAATVATHTQGTGPFAGLRPAARRCGSGGLRALPLQEEAASLLAYASVLLEQLPAQVEAMGPAGPGVFFGAFVLIECLSLPASPLMLSSGYLFGLAGGAGLALLSLCTAATISFFLARTVLRPQLMKVAAENDTFKDIDCAVQAEGFKIIFLLRLAPLLPFALSNYAYGLTQVSYRDFILATVFGCAPGTIAVVYLATAAKEAGGGGGQPWYVYAGSIAATVALLKVVTDVAQDAVNKSVEKDRQNCAVE